MTRKSSLMSKLLVFMLAFAVVFTYSVLPMNQAFAASKKPGKVKLSSVKATSSSTIKVTWKKASNAKKYQVYMATSKKGKYKRVATVSSSKRSYTKKSLKATKRYYFKVRAINGKKKGKFSGYKSAKTPKKEVLIDARKPEAYAGWAIDGDKNGGHLKGAVNISAQWLNTAYYAEDDNGYKTRDEAIAMALSDSKIKKSDNIVVYDTNGKDASKVAKYLKAKGYKTVAAKNYSSKINAKDAKLVTFKNYKLNVPAEVVKNISDHKVKGTALNANAKSIVGNRNIRIFHAEYAAAGKYTDDGYMEDNPIDWTKAGYYEGHVPGAEPISTDDFEPERYRDREIINNGENKVDWIADYLLRSDDELINKLAPKYGFKKDDFVVVVGPEPMATTKIAVVMKYLGIDNVYVMSGAYNEWDLNGYALEKNKINTVAEGTDITSIGNPDVIDSQEEVAAMLADPSKYQVIDTRRVEEFEGKQTGYSYHDIAGRIPGADINSPSGIGHSSSMYYYRNPDKTMRSPEVIEAMWKSQGVDTSKHMSFFCGSGWRAAEETWDAWVMGYKNASLYNDGWQGWSNEQRPFLDKDGRLVRVNNATSTIVPAAEGDIDYVAIQSKEDKSDWASFGIDAGKIKNSDYIIDVRPEKGDSSATVNGFVPGAVEVPVGNPYTEDQKAAIKKAADNQAGGGRIVIICVTGNKLAANAMAALQASGVDMKNVTYLRGGFGAWKANYPVVAADQKSVSVPAWVTEGAGKDGALAMIKKDDGSFAEDLTHHVLVNENGSNAPVALLNTKALPLQVYNALAEIKGVPCDKFNKAQCIVDGVNQNVFLPADAQKINVSFEWDKGTATMSDFFKHVTTATKDVKAGSKIETEEYTADMRFGGCAENIQQYFDSPSGNQTGCITCTFSCWIGTVSNAAYAYSTQESLVNRANVPAAGTAVTVVYTLGE